jgi:hypothetical protein
MFRFVTGVTVTSAQTGPFCVRCASPLSVRIATVAVALRHGQLIMADIDSVIHAIFELGVHNNWCPTCNEITVMLNLDANRMKDSRWIRKQGHVTRHRCMQCLGLFEVLPERLAPITETEKVKQ